MSLIELKLSIQSDYVEYVKCGDLQRNKLVCAEYPLTKSSKILYFIQTLS